MSQYLTLICHAATPTMRHGGFASPDEALDATALGNHAPDRKIAAGAAAVFTSPASAARETAAAFAVTAQSDDRLSDMGFGAWTGKTLAAVHSTDPEGLAAWIANPASGVPGGESLGDVRERIALWLSDLAPIEGKVVAFTHPMVIRAIIGAAIGVEDTALLRMDVAPLSVARLTRDRGWRLRAFGLSARADFG